MKENVLVLKTVRSLEAHLIVHCLNPKGAYMSFWAPSALKSQRRFVGGVLNPTHYISITYKRARTDRGLDILEEGVLIKDFSGLKKNYDRMELALYFLKLTSKVSQKGVQDSVSLFNLTKKALETTESYPNLEILKVYFELRLLEQQGVLPKDFGKEKLEAFKTWIKTKGHELKEEKNRIPFLNLKRRVQTALFSYTSIGMR